MEHSQTRSTTINDSSEHGGYTYHMAKNEMTISTEDAHETDNAPITVPSCRVKITKFVTEKANI